MTVPRQFHPLTYVGFRKSPALVAVRGFLFLESRKPAGDSR